MVMIETLHKLDTFNNKYTIVYAYVFSEDTFGRKKKILNTFTENNRKIQTYDSARFGQYIHWRETERRRKV